VAHRILLCLVLMVSTYCGNRTDCHLQRSSDGYEKRALRPTDPPDGQLCSPLLDHTHSIPAEALKGLFAIVGSRWRPLKRKR
jgi:hypothetical protein